MHYKKTGLPAPAHPSSSAIPGRGRGLATAVRAAPPVRLPTAQRTTEVPRSAPEALRCGVGGCWEAAGVSERAGGGDGGEADGGAGGSGGLHRQVIPTRAALVVCFTTIFHLVGVFRDSRDETGTLLPAQTLAQGLPCLRPTAACSHAW